MNSAEIRQQIVQILLKDFRVPEAKIKDEGTFRGTFGMDSLDAVDFVYLVQKQFAVEADLAKFSSVHSLGLLVAFLEEELAKKK